MPADEWYNRAIAHHGIEELGLNSKILIQSTQLPDIHNNPADRMIIATAIFYDAKILSKDQLIH